MDIPAAPLLLVAARPGGVGRLGVDLDSGAGLASPPPATLGETFCQLLQYHNCQTPGVVGWGSGFAEEASDASEEQGGADPDESPEQGEGQGEPAAGSDPPGAGWAAGDRGQSGV